MTEARLAEVIDDVPEMEEEGRRLCPIDARDIGRHEICDVSLVPERDRRRLGVIDPRCAGIADRVKLSLPAATIASIIAPGRYSRRSLCAR